MIDGKFKPDLGNSGNITDDLILEKGNKVIVLKLKDGGKMGELKLYNTKSDFIILGYDITNKKSFEKFFAAAGKFLRHAVIVIARGDQDRKPRARRQRKNKIARRLQFIRFIDQIACDQNEFGIRRFYSVVHVYSVGNYGEILALDIPDDVLFLNPLAVDEQRAGAELGEENPPVIGQTHLELEARDFPVLLDVAESHGLNDFSFHIVVLLPLSRPADS